MGFYQYVEIIAVLILVGCQVWVCIKVLKRTFHISTFLPNVNMISLKDVDIQRELNSNRGSEERHNDDNSIKHTDSENKDVNVSLGYYKAAGRVFGDRYSYYFREADSCESFQAVVQVVDVGGDEAIFKPYMTVGRLRGETSESFFYNIFEVVNDSSMLVINKVTVIKSGKCIMTDKGWKIVEKCRIKL